MSKFNEKAVGTKTVNSAGGEAFSQTKELELISLLFTSFGENQHYRSESDTYKRLKDLINLCEKKFVAKAIIYARTVIGMRSITHVAASEIAKHISGLDWAKDFYSSVIKRPDDMLEIISYHRMVNGKITNSMKKGFADAFKKFDSYSLAKYKGEGKDFKMVDLINLIHPIPYSKNGDAIKGIVQGTLKSVDTWEAMLTKAGQDAKTNEEKIKLKRDAWFFLITEKKLGYFALLRNLRNIIEQCPEIIPEAINQLTNEISIKNSLVLPFRFLSAFEEVNKIQGGSIVRDVLQALVSAVDISLSNVPKFDGDTLVVLDTSGSMSMNNMGQKSPHIIGSLFSSILVKKNNSDFMMFAEDAKYQNLNINDSVIGITNSLRFARGGTNFHSIFERANRKYDRIIILSDMQGWIGNTHPGNSLNEYKKRTGADPIIYSFDLQNYGTMMFPERNVIAVAGFSEKIFDFMSFMEEDKKALINKIKANSIL